MNQVDANCDKHGPYRWAPGEPLTCPKCKQGGETQQVLHIDEPPAYYFNVYELGDYLWELTDEEETLLRQWDLTNPDEATEAVDVTRSLYDWNAAREAFADYGIDWPYLGLGD